MLLRYILFLSLLGSGATALADTIDVNLSNSTAQFQYNALMGLGTQGKSEFHFGVLYNDVHSVLGDVGITTMSEEDAVTGISVGVGVKGLIATVNRGGALPRNNASALALGGHVRYSPVPVKRLGIVGEIYIAPKIISFGDASRYSQVGVGVEYEIMPQTVAYVGYRKIKFGIKDNLGDAILDGGYIGARLAF